MRAPRTVAASILALVAIGRVAFAADAKISELPAVTTPALTDQIPVNQGGTTKRLTSSQLLTLLEYSPDRHYTAANYAVREDWDASTAEQTWTWSNQDGSTASVSLDGLWLTGDLTDEHRFYTVANIPTGVDFTMTTRLSNVIAATGDSCGIAIFVTGTQATPTNWEACSVLNTTTDGFYQVQDTDFAAAGSVTRAGSVGHGGIYSEDVCLQMRYVDSARALSCWYAFDCKNWATFGTTTLANDPLAFGGFYVRRVGICRSEWFVVRTDATGIATPFPPGE